METNREETSSISQREYIVKQIEKNDDYLDSSKFLLKIIAVLSSIWIIIGTYFMHDSLDSKLPVLVSMVLVLLSKVISIAGTNRIVDCEIFEKELEQKLEIDDLIKSEGVASAREYLIENVKSAKSESKSEIIKIILSSLVSMASVALTGYLHFYTDIHILEAISLIIGSLSLDTCAFQTRKSAALLDYAEKTKIDLDLNTIKNKQELKRKKNY